MTEELTAAERDWIAGSTCATKRKLLRLYDAALTRAEVAEEERDRHEHNATVDEARLAAAETKLAAVEALRAASLDPRHGPGGCGIYARQLAEALSTGAPAPSPEALEMLARAQAGAEREVAAHLAAGREVHGYASPEPDPACIYAHCKQGGACLYPRSDGSCSVIEPVPSAGMPEGWTASVGTGQAWFRYRNKLAISTEGLRALLATQGLEIVKKKP